MSEPSCMVAQERQPKNGRSRISNGRSLFLDQIDQRSSAARLFRDIFQKVVSDQGGADRLSELQLQISRRAAALSTMAILVETKLAGGEEVNIGEFVSLVNALNRTGSQLGLQRFQKDATPTLESYFATHYSGGDDADGDAEAES
jgi:hypothetical protein